MLSLRHMPMPTASTLVFFFCGQEIDQRGLQVFLGIPSKQVRIAFPPEHLPKLRAELIDDVNEVVIGDVGWHGDLNRMLIFHWCHRPIESKVAEMEAAYIAADAVESFGLPVSVALTSALSTGTGPWEKVYNFRRILERYRTPEPPKREPCW